MQKLKCQKKVLPSAKTFADVLHLAQAAEEQEKQMLALHPSQPSRSRTNNISQHEELPITPPVVGIERATISKDSTFDLRGLKCPRCVIHLICWTTLLC